MELLPNLKRSWRRRRYQRLYGSRTSRSEGPVERSGGKKPRHWRIKAVRKLRRLRIAYSPLNLLAKLKNAYMNTMINLAAKVGNLDSQSVFGGKRILEARQFSPVASNDEFQARLAFEIYKSLIASKDLKSGLSI